MKPNRIEKLYKGWLLAAIAISLGLLSAFPASAQRNDKDALLKMMEEDRSTMDAIAGCDGNVQNNILLLSQTPEVLNIIQDLQKKSEKRFRDIIVPYDRDGQAALYNMARYPDLITELVRNGKPTNSEVNRIAAKYPADVQESAKKYARSTYDALRQIDQLNNEIDRDFQSYLAPYDEQTRASVNVLLKNPEIVSILVEDKDFTRLLGENYREDPQWVVDQLDKISAELEEQSKKDVAAYKQQVESDPEAYSEMLSAADRFASENNITRSYDAYVNPEINVTVVVNAYPYWFGYPYWYPYAYWRPYPAYYHTGFYYGPNRNLIFVGLPSSHFIYWQTHYHPTLYPHLSYCYYNYYHNHYLPYQHNWRRPMSHYAFYRSVEHNVINNPHVNNENLVRIDQRRGNNIVRQPDLSQPSTYYGRRTESSTTRQYNSSSGSVQQGSVSNEYSGRRGSVKRDAFPGTTPSVITPKSTDVYRQRSSGRSYETSGAPQSGQNGANYQQRSSSSQSSSGVNQSTRTQGYGNRNVTQPSREGSQTSSPQLRNYKNYRATEPRQASPAPVRSETRSAPSNAAPSQRQQQSAPQRTAPSTGQKESGPAAYFAPSARQQNSYSARVAPSARQQFASAERVSPSARQQYASAARVAPSARQQSAPAAHVAPSARQQSAPSARVAPSARQQSAPASHGNQASVGRSSGNSKHR
jgi:hypothetical protein